MSRFLVRQRLYDFPQGRERKVNALALGERRARVVGDAWKKRCYTVTKTELGPPKRWGLGCVNGPPWLKVASMLDSRNLSGKCSDLSTTYCVRGVGDGFFREQDFISLGKWASESAPRQKAKKCAASKINLGDIQFVQPLSA